MHHAPISKHPYEPAWQTVHNTGAGSVRHSTHSVLKAVPDLYFIGQRCKIVRVLMQTHLVEVQGRHAAAPALLLVSAARNTRRYVHHQKGAGAHCFAAARREEKQQSKVTACTCLHASGPQHPQVTMTNHHHPSQAGTRGSPLSERASSPEHPWSQPEQAHLPTPWVPQKAAAGE